MLDGGIPYYGWLGVHTNTTPKKEESVKLCGKNLAYIYERNQNGYLATCRDISLVVNGKIVGLSTYIFPKGSQRFYLIPLSPGGLKFEQNECFNIEVIRS